MNLASASIALEKRLRRHVNDSVVFVFEIIQTHVSNRCFISNPIILSVLTLLQIHRFLIVEDEFLHVCQYATITHL